MELRLLLLPGSDLITVTELFLKGQSTDCMGARVREFDDLQLLKRNIFDYLKYPSDLKIVIFTIQS